MRLVIKAITLVSLLLACTTGLAQYKVDVLVIGGGTGGSAAAIQSARQGALTLVAEPGPWLGGMMSAAGVSATDGNHRLPSGLWKEFRDRLYQVYGGPRQVETGWVSNTQFEPHVADSILKAMAGAENKLKVLFGHRFHSLQRNGNRIASVQLRNLASGALVTVTAKVYIDATELADVVKAAGIPYDLGMEADRVSGETTGVKQSSDIVQDLTYVAILKDFGKGADRTIPRPANYNPAEFDGACTDYYRDSTRKAPSVDAQKMLDYGRLPNSKYMLNWPNYGNDIYLNIVEKGEKERERELVKAKEQTLRFVYFIQHQLGFKHLGLTEDEFPTDDRLALMPYHREGRRVRGLVRFTMRHIAEPFSYGDPLYRTGISVGDYPIDHHHKKNPAAPQHLDFYPIPSFNVPLGALIPARFDNLIVAEKGISVSNIANGTTRLQPCVFLTGQAAGALAALGAFSNKAPREVPVRSVQQSLLKAKAFLMPYLDVAPEHPAFEAIQRIGATGILRGKGVPYLWANQTWFYPDSLVDTKTLSMHLQAFQAGTYRFGGACLLASDLPQLLEALRGRAVAPAKGGARPVPVTLKWLGENWKEWGLGRFDASHCLTRAELALVLDKVVDPFSRKAVDHRGRWLN
jgi:hypothetical protein